MTRSPSMNSGRNQRAVRPRRLTETYDLVFDGSFGTSQPRKSSGLRVWT